MRASRVFPVVLMTLAAPVSVWRLSADDILPRVQAATRYDAMAARSPFTAPTAAAPAPPPSPVAAGPHWWDQIFLTSLMELGSTGFAAIVDRASGKHYVLETNKPDEGSDLLLTEIRWGERTNLSTVVVRRGTETSPPLRFDTTAVSSRPVEAAPPMTPEQKHALLAQQPTPVPATSPSMIAGRRGLAYPAGPPGQPTPPANQSAPPRKIRPFGDTAPEN